MHEPAHYGLPSNEGTITLEKRPWTPPAEIEVAGEDERALVHRGGDDWSGRWRGSSRVALNEIQFLKLVDVIMRRWSTRLDNGHECVDLVLAERSER